jgi:hypothetical protein
MHNDGFAASFPLIIAFYTLSINYTSRPLYTTNFLLTPYVLIGTALVAFQSSSTEIGRRGFRHGRLPGKERLAPHLLRSLA